MQNSFTRTLVATIVASVFLAFGQSASAQGVTTASLAGFVNSKDGSPISGATVTALNVPSGTKSSTTTRSNGQYGFSGLRVGGPYTVTVSAKDVQPQSQDEIYLGIAQAEVVNFTLSNEIVVLEKLQVTASSNSAFDPGKMGTSNTFSRQQITQVPTARRDVQDIINLDTRVGLTINTSTGEFSVSAQGQNNRFNSFLVDGQQANDPFGINSNGFASLRSPIPLDAVALLDFSLSPYDVTRSGFTGALINAITKSGTNQFHGDVYTYYTGKSLRRANPGQGPTDPNKGVKDPLQEHTYGFSFGGPIIKDKLFFFVNYENYQRTGLSYSPVQFVPNAADLATILAAAKTYGIEPGGLASVVDSKQESFLAKIDWNINSNQRATLEYRRTDSSAPNFSNSSTFTQFTSNAYQSNRKYDNLTFLLNSNWTSNLRSEFGASGSKYNGTASPYTPLSPAIYINGVNGTDAVTGATKVGALDIGTNVSYQLNQLYTNDYNGHLYGEYSLGDHTIKFGADVDKNGYSDVFGQYYAGNYAFASPAAFAAGTPNYIRYQQAYTGGADTVAAATYHYSYTDAGLLLQDTWKPNQSLTIVGGLRFDYPYFPNKPYYLPSFQAAFGIPNNSVPTGNYTLAPRVGFNYKLPTKLKIQIRGGVGLFQGTNPAVWIGNAYGANGQLNSVTKSGDGKNSSSSTSSPPITAPYAPFNPDPAYVQTLAPPAAPTPSMSLTDPNFKVPTSWKDNIAVDVTLPWYGLVATAEANLIQVQKAVNYVNLNLLPSGTTPDGRILYSNSALHTNFSKSGVYELTNTDNGGSQSYTLQLARSMKAGWAFSVAYTHTHATEVQALTSAIASSNYTSRAVVNPNDDTAHGSLYAVPDKFVASATREFHFSSRKDAATRVTAVFRAQTGHPYSWVFGRSNDINNDGTSGNDAFYVPTGPDDPKIVWSTSASDPTGAVQAAKFWNFVNSTELKKYKGQIVSPNNSYSPWQHTLDLHVEQEIPLYHKTKLTVFADCINFANIFNKKWGVTSGIDFATGPNNGYTRGVANATINASGQYVYTFNSTSQTAPTVFTDLSRWQLQLGAKLEF
ncbi:MAG: carboxypeptidase regulatory-like domain-containing protein [Lacunisphaera sp.]